MARKKKRGDKSRAAQTANTNTQASPANAPQAPAPEAMSPETTRAPKSPRQPGPDTSHAAKRKSGVSVATTIIGMLLTLVLGLYIGSLLPGFFMASQQPQVAPPPPPQAAKPMEQADNAGNMDPALRQHMAELEKKAAANPDSAADWINLGNIYFDAHQPQKSISAYEHALAIAPRNPDVLTDLGIMYREIGRYEKAVECFRKALEIDPGHQNALFNAGVVLSNDLKLKAEAAAMWEQLLSLNPQAQAPNGAPLAEMVRELRQQATDSPDKL